MLYRIVHVRLRTSGIEHSDLYGKDSARETGKTQGCRRERERERMTGHGGAPQAGMEPGSPRGVPPTRSARLAIYILPRVWTAVVFASQGTRGTEEEGGPGEDMLLRLTVVLIYSKLSTIFICNPIIFISFLCVAALSGWRLALAEHALASPARLLNASPGCFAARSMKQC